MANDPTSGRHQTEKSVPLGDGAGFPIPSQVEQHAHWLKSVVLARLGEPQAVDEVLQEVCLAALSGRHQLSDPGKLGPWMYQIAIRQCLLHRRKHGRRRKLVERYVQAFQPHEEDERAPDPLAWLIAVERSRQFRQAMKELPARDREILLLKYHHDWSYRDISVQLGLSTSAVEARLHRARGRLRQRLVRMEVVDTI